MIMEIIHTLVKKNIINEKTTITVNAIEYGFGGTISSFRKEMGWNSTIKPESIIMIEGMDPVRFANSYGIKQNGKESTGKKRGRKPKKLINT